MCLWYFASFYLNRPCCGRSVLENSTRNTSTMGVKMLSRATAHKQAGQVVRATIPYIRSDVPIFIIFRALGFVSDRDILEHIVYSFEDNEMMEALRPSIEESQPIQSQEVSTTLYTVNCCVSNCSCCISVMIMLPIAVLYEMFVAPSCCFAPETKPCSACCIS